MENPALYCKGKTAGLSLYFCSKCNIWRRKHCTLLPCNSELIAIHWIIMQCFGHENIAVGIYCRQKLRFQQFPEVKPYLWWWCRLQIVCLQMLRYILQTFCIQIHLWDYCCKTAVLVLQIPQINAGFCFHPRRLPHKEEKPVLSMIPHANAWLLQFLQDCSVVFSKRNTATVSNSSY